MRQVKRLQKDTILATEEEEIVVVAAKGVAEVETAQQCP